MPTIGIQPILEKAIERVTGSFASISTEHKYIHEGQLFTCSVLLSAMAAGATTKILFKTPANGKYIHYRPSSISSSADKVTVSLFEGPTTVAGGTDLVAVNRRRVHPIASLSTLKTGVTTVADGTLIDRAYLGGGTGTGTSRSGDETGQENEIVFDLDTEYIITVNNGSSAANTVHLIIKWYEEDGI